MGRDGVLEIEKGGLKETIQSFFADLLQREIVDALLIPQTVPSGDTVVQTLVSKPEMLKDVDVFAPVMPVNSSVLVSRMTRLTPSQRKVGVVLRPCEIRALIELVKLKQASLENLIIIGLDCPGTYPVTEYAELTTKSKTVTKDFLKAFQGGEDGQKLRSACSVCEYPVPENADLVIGLFGVDHDKALLIQARTDQGEAIVEKLGLKEFAEGDQRDEAITKLVALRTKKRDELLKNAREEVGGLDNLLATLSTCITCHNCMKACPICFCKECFFESPTFDFQSENYFRWSDRRGAIRMPTDTLLFHLGRMNHMVTSCVACGMCEDACPNDIPLLKIFKTVGYDAQAVFDYVPGRSLDEELPLATFKEDELQEVGKA